MSRPLLLCEAHDPAAGWLAAGLAARGMRPEVVTSGQLLRARWRHEVASGGTRFEIRLRDGRVLAPSSVDATLNRLLAVPVHELPVAEADRDYAQQELTAVWLAWLESLPGATVNRPSPGGLSGVWLSRAEWQLRAGRAGLPTRPLSVDGGRPADEAGAPGSALSLLVVCGAVFGPPAAASLAAGCTALARDVDAELLEVSFDRDGEDVVFAGASTWPDLRPGGEAVLDRLAEALG